MLRNFTIVENEVIEEMVSKPTITSKFCILMTVYAGLLLVSNIIANKVIMPFGVVLPAAVCLYPICWVISDIMTECYGVRLSMMAIKTNAILNLFASIIFILVCMIPAAPFYEHSEAFNTILGNTPRIVIASLISYFLGDTVNSYSLSFFKAKLHDISLCNTFFFRAIVSSMFGQIFDTMGFIAMAFYGTMPNEVLFMMMAYQYTVKIIYEIICFPLTRAVVNWWKKVEGVDVVDAW